MTDSLKYSRWIDLSKNPLFLLTLITLVVTLYMLKQQIFIGVPYYDVFVYLNNALIFAGIPVGNMSVIYLSPLIPFLTSLVFRAGYVSANVIFILDGIIFLFGTIGLYLLFRERFNQVQSFTGSLIFISFPLVFTWAVSGGIDVPGVSFSIWTIYMLVLGVKKDSKFLYLIFPLFFLAFLARYTSVVLIFPITLYLLLNEDLSYHLKKIGTGFLVGMAIITPFLVYVYHKLGNLDPFLNIFTSTLFGSGATVNDLAFNPEKLYFLNNLLHYISTSPIQGVYGYIQSPHRGDPSVLSYIIAVMVLIGLGLYLYTILNNKFQEINDLNKKENILKFVLLVILVVLGVLSFFNASYLVAEIVFLGIFMVGFSFLKDSFGKDPSGEDIHGKDDSGNEPSGNEPSGNEPSGNEPSGNEPSGNEPSGNEPSGTTLGGKDDSAKNLPLNFLRMDFLFASWLCAFLIFHSIIPLKEDRYFITASPALAYFIILGLSTLIEKFKYRIKDRHLKSGLYLTIGLALVSFTLMVHASHVTQEGYGFYMQQACDWLKEYDPHYQDKVIYSNYDPAVTWSLKKEAKFGVPGLYVDSGAFANYLRSGKADYYIDAYSTSPPIPGYHIIKTIESISIYEKDS